MGSDAIAGLSYDAAIHGKRREMKVLLVDDHPLILAALQSLLRTLDDRVDVIGAASAAEARAILAEGAEPDLILLDLSLGDADGFDLLPEFRTAHPGLPIVVISASERTSDVIRAIDLGAMGFVPKRASNASLTDALRMVMAGGLYVPPAMFGFNDPPPVSSQSASADPPLLGTQAVASPHQRVTSLDKLHLTPRQRDVLGLLLKGLPNKLIARELNLSVETVKDHVAAVLRVLGVGNRTQAVLAVSQLTQGQGGVIPVGPRGPT